ncbi:hypothetical protein MBANPS3_000591 [Mucor bainieri]
MTINFIIPVFTGKEDPNHWLFRLEKIAKVNKWNDDEKLFKNFEQFKKMELISKHTKKVDLNKVVSDITTFKMKQGEKINEYIKRFESKRNAYQTEVVKRKLVNQDSKTNISGADASSSSNETKDEDVIELIITETGFLKYYFIKGITDKGMKRFVKSRKNPSLQSLYEVLRDIYEDSDFEYDSDASNSSGETDPQEDKKVSTKLAKTNDTKAYDMEDLTAQFKDMALMIVEEIRKGRNETTGQNEAPKRKKVNCYNCQGEDHIAANCKNPCKLCKSTQARWARLSGHRAPVSRAAPRLCQAAASYSVPHGLPHALAALCHLRIHRPCYGSSSSAGPAYIHLSSAQEPTSGTFGCSARSAALAGYIGPIAVMVAPGPTLVQYLHPCPDSASCAPYSRQAAPICLDRHPAECAARLPRFGLHTSAERHCVATPVQYFESARGPFDVGHS